MASRHSFAMNNCFQLADIQDPILRGNIIGIILLTVAIALIAYILPINHVARIFFRGQRYEGNLRTTHTRVVLNCEQITTLRGEPCEKWLADAQYHVYDENNIHYYSWQAGSGGCLQPHAPHPH